MQNGCRPSSWPPSLAPPAAAALLAQRHREAAPADVDVHALHALLLVMGAGRAVAAAGAAAPADPAEDLLGCFEAMLRCDPANEVAMAGGFPLAPAASGRALHHPLGCQA